MNSVIIFTKNIAKFPDTEVQIILTDKILLGIVDNGTSTQEFKKKSQFNL